MITKQELEAQLASHGQQHLLAFWDELSADQRQRLAEDILSVDFQLMGRLYEEHGSAIDWVSLADRAQPPPAIRLGGKGNKFAAADARARGEEALRAGKVGVIIVAGGQGTRLGFNAPKGIFPIGPVSNASLFQILLEQIVALRARYGASVPLYVMTSPVTHADTVAYMAEHGRFGLPEEDVKFFCQGTMPAVDLQTGQLLLADKDRLFRGPDGHGGMLAAFAGHRLLTECRLRGIEQLFYLQIDNPMVAVGDPEFLGYHLLFGSEMSTQVIAKQTPLDWLGNFVVVDGRAMIIEYSDLPREAGERRNPDGSLQIWAGSIGVHVFDVSFLYRMAESTSALPFHVAKKKVPFIDPAGRLVEPHRENAAKFERFIFDLLPHAERAVAVEVDERRAFAPVKNAPGEKRDTPESVKQQMVALHTEWLRAAGASIDDGLPVEISPLYANSAAELGSKIQPGLHITEPTYFR